MRRVLHQAFWRVGALALLLAWRPSPALADEVAKSAGGERATPLPELAKRYFQPLIDDQWAQGLVVGIIDERVTHVCGFGRKGEKQLDAPDGDTVFEIGSITKVFTGTLLADMAQRGLVNIDDPVNKLLPETIGPLECGGREMRLVDLATHTSGLPRLPSNLELTDLSDPYAKYTADDLLEFLKQHAQPSLTKSLAASLKSLLGTQSKQSWQYSNLGVGLLGNLLERKAGQPYEELVVERICRPLHMDSTRLTLDESMAARLIGGHDADGNAVKNWQFGCLAPCGGLRSTASDMLKFLAANLDMTETPLTSALAKMQQPHFTVKPHLEMGLNWLILKGDIVFHDGMTGGYSSLVGFSKSRKIGVVVLADTALSGEGGLLTKTSMAFLKALTEDKPAEPPTIRAATTVDPAVLKKYAGKYTLVPLLAIFTITCEEDRLYAVLTGQPRFRLYPESETKFFYKVTDAQITFECDESGKVERLILHQLGMDRPAARQSEPDAKQP